MYVEVEGGNHFIANTAEVENEDYDPISTHELVGGMAVAWLKLFLDGEEEYRELLFGEMPSEITEKLSRRISNKKLINSAIPEVIFLNIGMTDYLIASTPRRIAWLSLLLAAQPCLPRLKRRCHRSWQFLMSR